MASYFTTLACACLLLLAINAADGARIARQASKCSGGTRCIPLSSCSALQNLLRNPTRRDLIRIREALCTVSRRNPMVCCDSSATDTPSNTPRTPPNTPRTPPNTPRTPPVTPVTPPTNPGGGEGLLPAKCGQGTTMSRIFNGENVTLGAYPWMAVLGYKVSLNEPLDWGCGGALINDRYVLTAAHCIAPELNLQEIRLGEHNLDTPRDCITVSGVENCAPPHQTFRITPSQIIPHPNYDTRVPYSDDIALIRLDRPAKLNDFLQPICLPNPQINVRSFLNGREAVVAGWGRTEGGSNSRVLKRVRIPFVDLQQCQPFYRNLLVPEQLCFGGAGRRDSCNGDSGGPVFHANPSDLRYILMGVVSFGNQCGGDPAIYTKVSSYRSWILQNLRP